MILALKITALSPLAFPERKAGTQFRSSLPYVPGATLYGALGARCFERKRFMQLRCHNAYPASEEDEMVRPLPMTAIQPKGAENKDKGCEHDQDKEDDQTHDSLIARVCWEQQQPAALIYAPTDEDGRPWEASGQKFYTLKWHEDASYKLDTHSVQQRVLTRVAINRRRGTSQESMLYSPLVLREMMNDQPSQFRGTLVVPDEDKQVVLDALATITHLGGRQTSGLGSVLVEPYGLQDAATTTSQIEEEARNVKQRVKAMTDLFQKQSNLYQEFGGKLLPDGEFFTINLLSDAILFEQGWLPTQTLSADMLREACGVDAELLRSFTTTTVVGGWNVSWQRPKPTTIAVKMGGVYVFRATRALTEEDYRQLARLQLDGIGERRAEGYGQIRVCDEFHIHARRIS
jgi:CRISPR-associated protein Csx10